VGKNHSSRNYTADDIHDIIKTATEVYQAWIDHPARVVAHKMYEMGDALGLVSKPCAAQVQKTISVDRPPEEMYEEGATCSISGG